MHGMNDDVDMRHYGALSKAMPITFLTFAMGYLAIIGFPGFSGFWSKDKIIETALTQTWFVGVLAMIGAGITGFYMSRLMFMTFFTKKRWAEDVHPHESPSVMTVPLIVLAALSVLGGVMLLGNWIVDYLQPVTGTAPVESPPIPALAISVIVVLIVAVGVAVAWWFVQRNEVPRVAPQDVSFATRAARAELYGNEINDELAVKPVGALVSGLTYADTHGVDGFVEGTARAVGGTGLVLRRVQTGFVRSYALSLLVGAVLVVAALLAVNAA
jgi:NADH-quinone oxidoreductase subunit L